MAGAANDGPGVPLVLEPTLSQEDAQAVARASISQVYSQVISDLQVAKDMLPEDNGVRAGTYTASAMLARVYLQQANYEGARDEANRVIEEGIFGLNARFQDAFNNDGVTSEDIFTIQQTSQNNAGSTNSGLATHYALSQRDDIVITQAYIDLFDDPNDARANFFDLDPNSGELYTRKWVDPFTNIPVIRLAEMYLIRAEANQRLGTEVGDTPLNDINRLRNRANATPLVDVDLDDIILERRLELAFEGQRIHDLKRLQLPTDGFAFDAPELVLPIPQREIDVSNGLLTQNPGY
ncbi:MAG: RagB/SusD family nutrient uptake outer membrane protein [Bacteroidia bacterium]|nr:RagB/SusD family nutrient uptake outer membrane protein [Bacteroidia bacterium]